MTAQKGFEKDVTLFASSSLRIILYLAKYSQTVGFKSSLEILSMRLL